MSELSANKTPRVYPNAAGALLDLDFFMEFDELPGHIWSPSHKDPIHEGSETEPRLTLKYLGEEETHVESKPFSAVYLINNKNANGGNLQESS